METLKGHATKMVKTKTSSSPDAIEDFNHAWEVLFAYSGPSMALREVALGALPGKFPSLAVRQVIMDKHHAMHNSIRQIASLEQGQVDTCVFCKLAFGSIYEDPNFGRITITRNKRNKYYCNTCDMFLRICPGHASLELPVMVVDVKGSRKIRNDPRVSLYQYSNMLSDFQCLAAAVIQKNLGMVLNTVGDAVIGIWPSGFIPEELRKKHNWSEKEPAKLAARLALIASAELARLSPDSHESGKLPFKGALDSTIMSIFSVQSRNKIKEFEISDLHAALSGDPIVDDFGYFPNDEYEGELQKGPTSIDVAGEAIEFTSELSGHSFLAAGEFAITKRLDMVAGNSDFEYDLLDEFKEPIRVLKRAY
jgi:hypothetical protein